MSGTTFFENDLWTSVNHVLKNGGAVFIDHLVFAAAGTGTTRTSITTTYPVPNVAQELLAIRPVVAAGASSAAGDEILAMFDIQGSSYPYQPTQVLGPVGGPMLSTGTIQPTPSEWWTVRARVNAGDFYDYGVTPLVANTHNFRASYDLMWATAASGDSPIASQVSAVGTITTGGALGTATSVTLTNAKYLYEVATAVVSNGTVTADQPVLSYTNIQSSALSPIQSFNYGNEPNGTVVSTAGQSSVLSINRVMPLGVKFTVPNPSVNFSVWLDVTVSNAANFAHVIRYIKGQ